MPEELIVFVDKNGEPTGKTGPKLASHNAHTQLHLAFSCYIFRQSDHKFLMTQRSHSKKVWPGVYTNSVCGHPGPGESLEDGLKRRAAYELNLTHLFNIRCILPSYLYTTPPYNGIVENEFCPVFVAYTDQEPTPNPEEVESYTWLEWPAYVAMFDNHAAQMSYWTIDQVKQLQHHHPFNTLR